MSSGRMVTRVVTWPFEKVLVRTQGSVLVIQPHAGNVAGAASLFVDMARGKLHLGQRPGKGISGDYTVAHAVLGCLQLRTCMVVAVVTGAQCVAHVGGGSIYRVTQTQVMMPQGKVPGDAQDARMVSLFKKAVDPLTGAYGLYFGVQMNVTQRLNSKAGPSSDISDPDLHWNRHISQPMIDVGASQFVTPCILGFVSQISKYVLVHKERSAHLTLTLIARRSRHRAGTRHWRRGVDASGCPANFVETEQIMEVSSNRPVSFTQVRGSIPAAWSHVPNTRYKPPTALSKSASEQPFRAHVSDVTERYGSVVAINLANQKGSEGRLGALFQELTESQVPEGCHFRLEVFDFHHECKKSYENLSKLWEQVKIDFKQHGFYRGRGPLGNQADQVGVFRTNCIDCLDRTNVVQAFLARYALEAYLREMYYLENDAGLATTYPALEKAFKILWADHGDAMGMQYAGTGALKSGFTRTGKRTIMGLVDDGIKSAIRYYLNNYEDGHKQDAIDLFTGNFDPAEVELPSLSQSSGAMWVLGALLCLLASVSAALVAPVVSRVTIVKHSLPLLATSFALFGTVLALGKQMTCKPLLRPDLVQFWIGDDKAQKAKKSE